VTPNREMAPREALFVKLLWPFVLVLLLPTWRIKPDKPDKNHVSLSCSGVVSKRLNVSSQFLHHTVAQSLYFYEYQTRSRNSDVVIHCVGAICRCGIKISRCSTN